MIREYFYEEVYRKEIIGWWRVKRKIRQAMSEARMQGGDIIDTLDKGGKTFVIGKKSMIRIGWSKV